MIDDTPTRTLTRVPPSFGAKRFGVQKRVADTCARRENQGCRRGLTERLEVRLSTFTSKLAPGCLRMVGEREGREEDGDAGGSGGVRGAGRRESERTSTACFCQNFCPKLKNCCSRVENVVYNRE